MQDLDSPHFFGDSAGYTCYREAVDVRAKARTLRALLGHDSSDSRIVFAMRCSRFVYLRAALIASFSLSALACNFAHAQPASPMAGHNMGDMRPVTPPEQLPVPIHMEGIGNSHIAIKGSSEVQAWFDQGLSLLHDFWDYESARAFEQSVRVDPQCAMCYWGLYKAESFYLSTAQGYALGSLASAVALKNPIQLKKRVLLFAGGHVVNGVQRNNSFERVVAERQIGNITQNVNSFVAEFPAGLKKSAGVDIDANAPLISVRISQIFVVLNGP